MLRKYLLTYEYIVGITGGGWRGGGGIIPGIKTVYTHNLTWILSGSLTVPWLPGFLVDHKYSRAGLPFYIPTTSFSPIRDWTTPDCHCLVICVSSTLVYKFWEGVAGSKVVTIRSPESGSTAKAFDCINRFRAWMHECGQREATLGNQCPTLYPMPHMPWQGPSVGLGLGSSRLSWVTTSFPQQPPQVAGSGCQYLVVQTLRCYCPIWPKWILRAKVTDTVVYIWWFVQELKRRLLSKHDHHDRYPGVEYTEASQSNCYDWEYERCLRGLSCQVWFIPMVVASCLGLRGEGKWEQMGLKGYWMGDRTVRTQGGSLNQQEGRSWI